MIFFVFLVNFKLLFTHHYPARCFGINMPNSIAAGNLVHRFRNNYTTHLSANPIAQV